ncbi:MAG: phosphate ABC transporter substrate-binding protein [Acidobacteria bacterium]|nr:phosphate ABC transporter substrate-binding protein [Acidobacteriota bacterium]
MRKLLALSFIFAMLEGCGGGEAARTASTPTPAPSNQMSIVGSTTLLPVAEKAVEVFKQRNPESKITLSGSGSLVGINALVDGITDIAMSSRVMKNEEKEMMRKKKGTEAKEHIVAWDGIVPIVHPSNPVKNLTLAQLKDIYTGKITDWKQVGGKGAAIVVVTRDFTSGTSEAWSELILDKEPVVAGAKEKGSSSAILEAVAKDPNAIGYDGIGYAEGDNRVKPLSVDGVMASASAILDKSYKIARPIYMITNNRPTTIVVEFIDFITSPEGQALVKEAKFVPVPEKQ